MLIEQTIALSYAGAKVRPLLSAFLALDRRLGQFVSQSKEGMLTQMRIAWWRDQFAKHPKDRPNGDPILDALNRDWVGEESALTTLADGWEALLSEPPIPEEAGLEFASGRSACFAAIARMAGGDARRATHCGMLWAFADLTSRMEDEDERATIYALAEDQCERLVPLSFQLRSLTILGFLGKRSLRRRDGKLISGRGDLAHVLRIGTIGR